jgi:hypothetical protein
MSTDDFDPDDENSNDDTTSAIKATVSMALNQESLKNVSKSSRKGAKSRVVAILGRAGAGKSFLSRALLASGMPDGVLEEGAGPTLGTHPAELHNAHIQTAQQAQPHVKVIFVMTSVCVIGCIHACVCVVPHLGEFHNEHIQTAQQAQPHVKVIKVSWFVKRPMCVHICVHPCMCACTSSLPNYTTCIYSYIYSSPTF